MFENALFAKRQSCSTPNLSNATNVLNGLPSQRGSFTNLNRELSGSALQSNNYPYQQQQQQQQHLRPRTSIGLTEHPFVLSAPSLPQFNTHGQLEYSDQGSRNVYPQYLNRTQTRHQYHQQPSGRYLGVRYRQGMANYTSSGTSDDEQSMKTKSVPLMAENDSTNTRCLFSHHHPFSSASSKPVQIHTHFNQQPQQQLPPPSQHSTLVSPHRSRTAPTSQQNCARFQNYPNSAVHPVSLPTDPNPQLLNSYWSARNTLPYLETVDENPNQTTALHYGESRQFGHPEEFVSSIRNWSAPYGRSRSSHASQGSQKHSASTGQLQNFSPSGVQQHHPSFNALNSRASHQSQGGSPSTVTPSISPSSTLASSSNSQNTVASLRSANKRDSPSTQIWQLRQRPFETSAEAFLSDSGTEHLHATANPLWFTTEIVCGEDTPLRPFDPTSHARSNSLRQNQFPDKTKSPLPLPPSADAVYSIRNPQAVQSTGNRPVNGYPEDIWVRKTISNHSATQSESAINTTAAISDASIEKLKDMPPHRSYKLIDPCLRPQNSQSSTYSPRDMKQSRTSVSIQSDSYNFGVPARSPNGLCITQSISNLDSFRDKYSQNEFLPLGELCDSLANGVENIVTSYEKLDVEEKTGNLNKVFSSWSGDRQNLSMKPPPFKAAVASLYSLKAHSNSFSDWNVNKAGASRLSMSTDKLYGGAPLVTNTQMQKPSNYVQNNGIQPGYMFSTQSEMNVAKTGSQESPNQSTLKNYRSELTLAQTMSSVERLALKKRSRSMSKSSAANTRAKSSTDVSMSSQLTISDDFRKAAIENTKFNSDNDVSKSETKTDSSCKSKELAAAEQSKAESPRGKAAEEVGDKKEGIADRGLEGEVFGSRKGTWKEGKREEQNWVERTESVEALGGHTPQLGVKREEAPRPMGSSSPSSSSSSSLSISSPPSDHAVMAATFTSIANSYTAAKAPATVCKNDTNSPQSSAGSLSQTGPAEYTNSEPIHSLQLTNQPKLNNCENHLTEKSNTYESQIAEKPAIDLPDSCGAILESASSGPKMSFQSVSQREFGPLDTIDEVEMPGDAARHFTSPENYPHFTGAEDRRDLTTAFTEFATAISSLITIADSSAVHPNAGLKAVSSSHPLVRLRPQLPLKSSASPPDPYDVTPTNESAEDEAQNPLRQHPVLGLYSDLDMKVEEFLRSHPPKTLEVLFERLRRPQSISIYQKLIGRSKSTPGSLNEVSNVGRLRPLRVPTHLKSASWDARLRKCSSGGVKDGMEGVGKTIIPRRDRSRRKFMRDDLDRCKSVPLTKVEIQALSHSTHTDGIASLPSVTNLNELGLYEYVDVDLELNMSMQKMFTKDHQMSNGAQKDPNTHLVNFSANQNERVSDNSSFNQSATSFNSNRASSSAASTCANIDVSQLIMELQSSEGDEMDFSYDDEDDEGGGIRDPEPIYDDDGIELKDEYFASELIDYSNIEPNITRGASQTNPSILASKPSKLMYPPISRNGFPSTRPPPALPIPPNTRQIIERSATFPRTLDEIAECANE